MAKVICKIPDGSFCADHGHLGCLYEDHCDGIHRCTLYNEMLNPLEKHTIDGELIRLRRKCSSCLKNMTEDTGRGYHVETD